MISRRHLLASSLPLAGLALPGLARRGRAAAPASERRFLFVVARGGWDTTYVFTPAFDSAYVDTEAEATVASVGDLRFVDAAARPSVSDYFSRFGDRSVILNGMEVRSVTHERCERILLTGSTGSSADDWPGLIAGNARTDLLLPHLVIYGSAYSQAYTESVVRVGNNGQLPDLLSGEALLRSGVSLDRFTTDLDALAEAHVRARANAYAAAAGAGAARRFGDGYGRMLDTLSEVYGLTGTVSLDPTDAGCTRDLAADGKAVLDCFELGLSRCGMVQYDGWCGEGWDTHADNAKQGEHFELLFGYLADILADLDTRTSISGAPLADEVVVVVLSEMGRHPQLNAGAGKDHWTFTSAMLVGSGLRGGQVIGAMDDGLQGLPIDLASGAQDDDGVRLVPGHLGATLLALADLDPGDFLPAGEQPIAAALV